MAGSPLKSAPAAPAPLLHLNFFKLHAVHVELRQEVQRHLHNIQRHLVRVADRALARHSQLQALRANASAAFRFGVVSGQRRQAAAAG